LTLETIFWRRLDPPGHEAGRLLSLGSGWQLAGRECRAVGGCLDIDLAFSPSTNLLPIRRLNLRPGEAAEVRAAWLRFSELVLEPLDQVYHRIDQSSYRYESGGGAFVAILRTNAAGFVTSYPGLWEAVHSGPA
jgi:hypothetical protein